MKVKVKSTGTPSPALAGAFVRLLVAAVERKPELKIVPKAEKAKTGQRLNSQAGGFIARPVE